MKKLRLLRFTLFLVMVLVLSGCYPPPPYTASSGEYQSCLQGHDCYSAPIYNNYGQQPYSGYSNGYRPNYSQSWGYSGRWSNNRDWNRNNNYNRHRHYRRNWHDDTSLYAYEIQSMFVNILVKHHPEVLE